MKKLQTITATIIATIATLGTFAQVVEAAQRTGSQASGSKYDLIDISLNFGLFSQTINGNLIKDSQGTINDDKGRFLGAIENLELGVQISQLGNEEKLDKYKKIFTGLPKKINRTNLNFFAKYFSKDEPAKNISGDRLSEFGIDVDDNTVLFSEEDTIEYTITGDDLIIDGKKIELTFILDCDNYNFCDDSETIEKAVNDLDFIINENLLDEATKIKFIQGSNSNTSDGSSFNSTKIVVAVPEPSNISALVILGTTIIVLVGKQKNNYS
jgi:hypothetical protein